MKTFLVMIPPGGDPQGERTLFLRDGFAFLALVLPVVWLLFHRLWLWALAFLAIAIAENWLMASDGWFLTGFALSAASALFAGLEGNRLRMERLERQGWTVAAVIDAETLDDAEAFYFADRQASPEVIPQEVPQPTPPSAPLRPAESFGLFEWNGVR